MNSPLYAISQRFAEGGYADGGDVSYVTGPGGPTAVEGGITPGFSVAGTTRPRPTLSSFDRLMLMTGKFSPSRFANAGLSRADMNQARNIQFRQMQKGMRNPRMGMGGQQMNQPTPQPAMPTPQPAMPAMSSIVSADSYPGAQQATAPSWYNTPVNNPMPLPAPVAVQQYAQGGAVQGDSAIMNALRQMGYDPYA